MRQRGGPYEFEQCQSLNMESCEDSDGEGGVGNGIVDEYTPSSQLRHHCSSSGEARGRDNRECDREPCVISQNREIGGESVTS